MITKDLAEERWVSSVPGPEQAFKGMLMASLEATCLKPGWAWVYTRVLIPYSSGHLTSPYPSVEWIQQQALAVYLEG